MKTREQAFPGLVQASRDPQRPRSETGETGPHAAAGAGDEPVDLSADLVEDEDTGDITSPGVRVPTGEEAAGRGDAGAPGAAVAPEASAGQRDTMKTAEINLDRDRRPTLTSPISALIAESMIDMTDMSAVKPGRDPAAPEPEGVREQTRRVGDSDRQGLSARDKSAGYTVEVVNDANAARRQRAARLIYQARALMESGALAGAVVAAEQALEEAESAAPPGIAEIIEPARPLLAQVFAAFVGSMDEVPVLARRTDELRRMPLDERKRAVIAQVDGVRSLSEVLDGAHIHATDALRVAASLLRAGVIRVV
jgi:hypothetical protein